MTSIRPRWLAIAAGMLFIFGSKCWLIARYGSPTPIWDEWGALGAGTFKSYLTGTLDFSQLIAHHNEHRVFFTRLFGLASLKAVGYWDPVVNTLVNAAVHTLAIGFMLVAIRGLLTHALFVFTLFTMVAVSLPFAWENLLGAFQIQFYLLILFGMLSLYFLFDARAWSMRWWIGVALGIAGYFAMASAALTLPAFVALALAHIALRRRLGLREWLALGCLVLIAAVMIHDIPTLHSELVASLSPKF